MRTIAPEMVFGDAVDLWLGYVTLSEPTRHAGARYLRANTENSYHQYAESLRLFFDGMPLKNIHFGNLREYQRLRSMGDAPFIRRRRPHEEPRPLPASGKKVNQELGMLRRMMRMAGCWDEELEQFYRPLMEEVADVPRALTVEEQEHWLRTAQSRVQWQVVYLYSLLALGTGMSTNELRLLRMGDVSLDHRTVTISREGAKCKPRQRTIALVSSDELWAAEHLLKRARALGSTAFHHYLFPIRVKTNVWDPARPMSTSGIKREWNQVRAASGLGWFRQYDLRHTAATRMAEDGVRPEIRKARMGHTTQRMQDHYTHIMEQAQRREMERVAVAKRPPHGDVYRFGAQRGVQHFA